MLQETVSTSPTALGVIVAVVIGTIEIAKLAINKIGTGDSHGIGTDNRVMENKIDNLSTATRDGLHDVSSQIREMNNNISRLLDNIYNKA